MASATRSSVPSNSGHRSGTCRSAGPGAGRRARSGSPGPRGRADGAVRPVRVREGRPERNSASAYELFGSLRGEGELTALVVHLDRLPWLELRLEQPHGERVLDPPLNGALERPCAEVGVEAFLGERVARRDREREPQLAIGQHPPQGLEMEVDDGADVL